ncbi:bifunctional phosphopantothenoylcysteine decarboxylase/phosphopantothenate--cysteine ligase CoaBC [Taylorella equigenitalis]|uniref:Coenzyme A biosynthesis bifunctional protein CoaBC n=2 Tax=Taylorella equigenitalis TaxID=29575 RepID=I7JIX6_9BURK|nr:bifunctional phosphopantothenoylcysteine decarboxylase/phosphopantothenate--cysteine ligase CoaBC [Taylorella equigenitalis]AFN36117.1 coenzyme A biosynthesis bifunctional protein [Taylorella equigenitalis ATCC 35865]ASY30752.1 phosphopantothenate synthase [Taylorella equigenitalis]ASY38051.1 bifunctional phosphopantothenoylcysteine decarboxylase/phosphopantothenate--cysteine ligase CoaBC [Taylorella equigenitalis]ASY39529.1 phosphopantothenate synthase [Taylorella equigenitalis]ASY42471.1 
MRLENKKILLGMTGGIACYKVAYLCRKLKSEGADVTVVMTEAAKSFITPTTMQALSGHPVFSELLDPNMSDSMSHIHLSRDCDLVLIAPCTANFIAKLAHGIADDLLSSICLASNKSIAIVPSMNSYMWTNRATQKNYFEITSNGIFVWGPDSGLQACGEDGYGRMLEPEQITEEVVAFFKPKIMEGLRVLITAGPTQEDIDPVRYLGNRSSGKTGYEIAKSAYEHGAEVHLISGPTCLDIPYGVSSTQVSTAVEMHKEVIQRAKDYDIFISVAAVADWHLPYPSEQKIKKNDGVDTWKPNWEFQKNPDILAEVASIPDGPWCVGFAAETENLEEYGSIKRERKSIPLLVGNLAQYSMGKDTTTFLLFDSDGIEKFETLPKSEAADKLITAIHKRFNKNA